MMNEEAVAQGVIFPCIRCGGPATKAMYMGVPFKLCGDKERCALVWGSWDFLIPFLTAIDVSHGEGFVFIRYTRYWPCLWEFVSGKIATKECE